MKKLLSIEETAAQQRYITYPVSRSLSVMESGFERRTLESRACAFPHSAALEKSLCSSSDRRQHLGQKGRISIAFSSSWTFESGSSWTFESWSFSKHSGCFLPWFGGCGTFQLHSSSSGQPHPPSKHSGRRKTTVRPGACTRGSAWLASLSEIPLYA